MGNLKGESMKSLLLKALVVLVISAGSGDLFIAMSIISIYIVVEISLAILLKMVRINYTKKLIQSNYFCKN